MRYLIAFALMALSLRSFSANPDDAAWLIYDVSYGDYFLLRVEMKSSKTGYANVAGGNRYAGRRYTDQGNRFGVSMLGGKVTLNRDGAVPFMVGSINAAGDEFSGEFLNASGASAGRFVGALQGHTSHQMDLYQLCKRESHQDHTCANRGRDEGCRIGSHPTKSTFFTLENCESEITYQSQIVAPPPTATKPAISDPTGTWLLYDEKMQEYVLARLVVSDFEGREPGMPFKGTYVFSGPKGMFDSFYFGRRDFRVGSTGDHGQFVIRGERSVEFIHSHSRSLHGEIDFATNTMGGTFRPKSHWDDDLGPGTWTAEKKSDDPNFALSVFRYCGPSGRADESVCTDVGLVKADGTNRPDCRAGYSSGPTTFLSERKCEQLRRIRCQVSDRADKGLCAE